MTRQPDRISAAEYRRGKAKAGRGARIKSTRTERGGEVFQSKREANRWSELLLEEQTGAITELDRQVEFALVVGHTLICKYIADFTYLRGKRFVCEDSKGHRTETFILKKKLMYACHGIRILET